MLLDEPVVPLFGFGAHCLLSALASFWQADRLAYLQFSAPPGDVSMQYFPMPVACCEDSGDALLAPGELLDGDICALAMEMPAINAATAVKVVNVFMMSLLEGECRECGTDINEGVAAMFRELARHGKNF
jgi:hypothetical protein